MKLWGGAKKRSHSRQGYLGQPALGFPFSRGASEEQLEERASVGRQDTGGCGEVLPAVRSVNSAAAPWTPKILWPDPHPMPKVKILEAVAKTQATCRLSNPKHMHVLYVPEIGHLTHARLLTCATHTHTACPLFQVTWGIAEPWLLCLRGTSMLPTETLELTLAGRHVGNVSQQGESTTTSQDCTLPWNS